MGMGRYLKRIANKHQNTLKRDRIYKCTIAISTHTHPSIDEHSRSVRNVYTSAKIKSVVKSE